MRPETKRTQNEDKTNRHAIGPNLSNYLVVHKFSRQPFFLNVALVEKTLSHLTENI